MWGGRFSKRVNQELNALNRSLGVDQRLWKEDIIGSIAYAEALCSVGILTEDELDKIQTGLEKVKSEWKDGSIRFLESDEDVHTVNERRLTELIGEVGGKLHTGRSRNDQVVTDMKLWLKTAIEDLRRSVKDLCFVITERAEELIEILIPGYTHLQRAQVIRFSHWLMSYGFSFESDLSRFSDLLNRHDSLPLGSGAIAGNPFNIDRDALAERLQFKMATPNSMLAVGDRDFIGENKENL